MQDNLHIELKKKKEKYQSNFKIVDSGIEVKSSRCIVVLIFPA